MVELIKLEDLATNLRIVSREPNVILIRVRNSNYIAKIKIPFEPSPELASLIGHALGDGHIAKTTFDYTNKNKGLIEEVEAHCKNLFQIKGRIIYRRDAYEIFFPLVVAKLLFLCGAPKGRKTTQQIHLPNWIVYGSHEIKSSFLRALFDDEGWVGVTPGNFTIGFAQNKKEDLIGNHRKYMEQIKSMVQEFGIKTSGIFKIPQKNNSIQLGFKIIGRGNIERFLHGIGFTHKEKQDKASKILISYKQIQYSKKEAKTKVLETLQTYGPLRSGHLGVLLNRDQKTIWKHLHKLVEKDLVTKIGTKNKVLWQLKNNINPNNKI